MRPYYHSGARFVETGPWITLDHFHSVAIISPTAAAGHTLSHNIAFIHPLRLGTISSRVGWKEGRGFFFFCASFYPGGCAENKYILASILELSSNVSIFRWTYPSLVQLDVLLPVIPQFFSKRLEWSDNDILVILILLEMSGS